MFGLIQLETTQVSLSSYYLNSHCVCVLVAQLCPTLRTVVRQAPPSTEFSRQEYWSRLPFPSPGDLSNPRIERGLLDCRQILYHLSPQGLHSETKRLQINVLQSTTQEAAAQI